MKGSLFLFLSLLLVNLGKKTLTDSNCHYLSNALSSDTCLLCSLKTTAVSSSSTASVDNDKETETSTTKLTASSGSADATAKTTVSSGSPDATAKTTASSGSPDATAKTTASSGSPDATAKTTASSGSPDATAKTTVSSESPDVSTQSPQTNSPVTKGGRPTKITICSPTDHPSPNLTSSLERGPETCVPGTSDPCKSNSCGRDASCVNLFSDHYCLCPQGYYYRNLSCVKGKTFPGEISIMNVTDQQELSLQNETSETYQDFHNSVIEFFASALNKSDFGFGQTIIFKVSDPLSLSARSAMPAAEKTFSVSIVNMFDENTTQNETTISGAIKKAIKDKNISMHYTNVCDFNNCKQQNDTDKCQNGFQCQCKPGYIRPSKLIPFCVLSPECSEPCNAQEGKQCVRTNGKSECVCMPGYQKNSDKCEECPFGYSGTDCKDQFQLILTIVGTIAGALILILLIALIVSVSSKKKKKNVEEQQLIEDDFRNIRLQQGGFSNSGDSSSIFPKVRTGVPSQTQNPYANQRSMSRPDY
uniref:Mucin-13 n=1 Tax=Cricetulus griseus TaxID=10029 RepID=A0A8C2LWT5_CRIGR